MSNTYAGNVGTPQNPSAVRVECEAVDCGALLEVQVPSQHDSSSPLIVRCGSCQRLLEVWLQVPLSKRENPGNGRTKVDQQPLHRDEILTASSPSSLVVKRRHTAPTSSFIGYGQTPQLVKPPPLSRFTADSAAAAQLQHDYMLGRSGTMLGAAVAHHGLHPSHAPADRPAYNNPFTHKDVERPGFGHPHRHPIDLSGFPELQDEEFGLGPKQKKSRKTRNPSPYNLFMSEEVKRIKAEQPAVDHKQAFKMAARHWAKSPHDCRKISGLQARTTQGVEADPLLTRTTASTQAQQGNAPAGEQYSISVDKSSSTSIAIDAANKGVVPPIEDAAVKSGAHRDAMKVKQFPGIPGQQQPSAQAASDPSLSVSECLELGPGATPMSENVSTMGSADVIPTDLDLSSSEFLQSKHTEKASHPSE